MSAGTFLSEKLRLFNTTEYILVMAVYFVVGLLIVSIYPPLRTIDWWFYLIMMVIGVFPILIHLISQPKGSLKFKFQSCVKSNSPSLQILLFFVMFFFSCISVLFVPSLAYVKWWLYLILIVILSIKPLQKNWFW